MKAQEVRLGNYVMDYDESHKIFKVKSIKKEKRVNMFFINGRWDNDVLPIPLTEEWLLKLGFEKNPSDMPLYYLGPLFINMGNHGIVHVLINKGNYFTPFQDCTKYVHQLQNLYFALTGEKLNLK
jgi:hypothetical protein